MVAEGRSEASDTALAADPSHLEGLRLD
jgi:hypothetical protein